MPPTFYLTSDMMDISLAEAHNAIAWVNIVKGLKGIILCGEMCQPLVSSNLKVDKLSINAV